MRKTKATQVMLKLLAIAAVMTLVIPVVGFSRCETRSSGYQVETGPPQPTIQDARSCFYYNWKINKFWALTGMKVLLDEGVELERISVLETCPTIEAAAKMITASELRMFFFERPVPAEKPVAAASFVPKKAGKNAVKGAMEAFVMTPAYPLNKDVKMAETAEDMVVAARLVKVPEDPNTYAAWVGLDAAGAVVSALEVPYSGKAEDLPEGTKIAKLVEVFRVSNDNMRGNTMLIPKLTTDPQAKGLFEFLLGTVADEDVQILEQNNEKLKMRRTFKNMYGIYAGDVWFLDYVMEENRALPKKAAVAR